MKRSRATVVAVSLAPCLLLVNACGLIGDIFGERDPVLYVRNDTADTFYVGSTDYADGDAAIASDVPTGDWGGVGWGECKTAWLVLRKGQNVNSEELARHELTLCAGDKVVVGSDYGVIIECRERNQVRSEPEC